MIRPDLIIRVRKRWMHIILIPSKELEPESNDPCLFYIGIIVPRPLLPGIDGVRLFVAGLVELGIDG